MNLEKRLRRLEKALSPPREPSVCAVKMAMIFTREELERIRDVIERRDRGEPYEDTELQEFFRRYAALAPELDRECALQMSAPETVEVSDTDCLPRSEDLAR